MGPGTSRSADVLVKNAGWTWTGASTAVVGTGNASGTAIFGFTIYRNIAGIQSLTINKDENFGGKIVYRVEVRNPSSPNTFTIQRLLLELYCLGWASTNRLPRIGDKFFDSSVFGSNPTTMSYPIVTNIAYTQERDNDPSAWLITYTVERPHDEGRQSYSPKPGNRPNKPSTEEYPWDIGPKVTISMSSENFVLGLGRFVGTKTPAEVGGALDDGTYAAQFTADMQKDMEIISNSAGDPLESPPPMKVMNATITITRAYQTLPSGFTDNLTDALEEVCTNGVVLKGVSFGPYTCKLTGATVSSEKLKRTAEWLPRQQHPFRQTYADVGWTPPAGMLSTDVAYNYTRGVLPAFEYVDYFNVSLAISYRRLGWGYALVDKGYRKLVNGVKTEITDVSGRQTYTSILENGNEVDRADNTSDKKVLRLYQVLKSGSTLTSILNTVLEG